MTRKLMCTAVHVSFRPQHVAQGGEMMISHSELTGALRVVDTEIYSDHRSDITALSDVFVETKSGHQSIDDFGDICDRKVSV